jgi:hypothetical protein
MQGEDIFELTDGSVMHLHFNMQVEDMFELTNVKCHAFTFKYACKRKMFELTN